MKLATTLLIVVATSCAATKDIFVQPYDHCFDFCFAKNRYVTYEDEKQCQCSMNEQEYKAYAGQLQKETQENGQDKGDKKGNTRAKR